MSHQYLAHILLLVFGLTVMSSCAPAKPSELVAPSPSPSPDPSATATFLDARERLARIEPGQSSAVQVLEILGKPEVEQVFEGRDQWWYNPPQAWVICQDGVVIEKSILPKDLGEVVQQYGPPDKIVLRIARDVQHNVDMSDTFFLYRQYHRVFGMSGVWYAFTSDMHIGGYHIAPEYYDEFVHERGLDGSFSRGEIKVIAWPGLSTTLTPAAILTPTFITTVTPTLKPLEDFVLKAYANLVATYDTGKWRWYFNSTSSPTGASFENALYSLQFTSCNIQEQGATEIGSPASPPPDPNQVRLGQITYDVYRFDRLDSGLNAAWYVDRNSLAEYSDADGLPIFIVSSTSAQWQECESEARKVLETVHVQE